MNAASSRASVVHQVRVGDVLRRVGVAVPNDPRKLAKCPLHDDSTASFRIFDRGWRCFGCGAHGGVLDLVVALGKAYDRAGAARWLESLG